jgi:hypothetical protein
VNLGFQISFIIPLQNQNKLSELCGREEWETKTGEMGMLFCLHVRREMRWSPTEVDHRAVDKFASIRPHGFKKFDIVLILRTILGLLDCRLIVLQSMAISFSNRNCENARWFSWRVRCPRANWVFREYSALLGNRWRLLIIRRNCENWGLFSITHVNSNKCDNSDQDALSSISGLFSRDHLVIYR